MAQGKRAPCGRDIRIAAEAIATALAPRIAAGETSCCWLRTLVVSANNETSGKAWRQGVNPRELVNSDGKHHQAISCDLCIAGRERHLEGRTRIRSFRTRPCRRRSLIAVGEGSSTFLMPPLSPRICGRLDRLPTLYARLCLSEGWLPGRTRIAGFRPSS